MVRSKGRGVLRSKGGGGGSAQKLGRGEGG